jgi:hypothetical protein
VIKLLAVCLDIEKLPPKMDTVALNFSNNKSKMFKVLINKKNPRIKYTYLVMQLPPPKQGALLPRENVDNIIGSRSSISPSAEFFPVATTTDE